MHTLLKLAYYILIMCIPENKNQTIAWGFPDLFDDFDELHDDMEFVDGKTFKEQRDKTVTNITWDKDKKQFVSHNYDNKELDRVSIPEIDDYIKNRVKWISKVSVNSDGTSFDFFNVDDKLLFNVPIKELENFKKNEAKYYADSKIEDGVLSFMNTDGKVIKTLTLPKDPHTGEYFTGVRYNTGSGSLDFLNSSNKVVASVNIPQVDTKKYLTSTKLNGNTAQFLNEDGDVISSFDIPKGVDDTELNKFVVGARKNSDNSYDLLNRVDGVVSNIAIPQAPDVHTEKYFAGVSQSDKTVTFTNDKGDSIGTITLPDTGSGGGSGGIEPPPPPTGTIILNDIYDMDGNHKLANFDSTSSGNWYSASIKLKVLNLSNETKTSDVYDIQYGFSIEKVLVKIGPDYTGYPKEDVYEIPKGKYRINFACNPKSSLNNFDLSDDKMFTFYSSQVFVGTNNNLNFTITPYYDNLSFGSALMYPLQSTSAGKLTLELIDTTNINIEQKNSDWIEAKTESEKNWVIKYKAKVDGKTILRDPNGLLTFKDNWSDNQDTINSQYSKDGTVTLKGKVLVDNYHPKLVFNYPGYSPITLPITKLNQ